MNSPEVKALQETIEVQLKQKEHIIDKLEEINAVQAAASNSYNARVQGKTEQLTHRDAQL